MLAKCQQIGTFVLLKIVCMHTMQSIYCMNSSVWRRILVVEMQKSLPNRGGSCKCVVMDGIEPPTQGFSVLCSTN